MRGNNRYSDNSRSRREFNRIEGQGVADNRRFGGRRQGGQSDHRFHNQGGRQGGSRNSAFRGIDFMKESKLTLDFDQKSLIIPDDQIKQLPKVEKPAEINLSDTKLGEGQKQKLKDLFNGFKGLFSDQPGLTHVSYHENDTGDQGPVVSRPYRYDRASPVVLTRKNNGLPPDSPEAYRFAIDYHKLNAITKYPRYPLPVIDDLITNIPHTGVMSTLDLKSGYFQLAISPKDIEKTAFITRNGIFAFLRMPFGLSGVAPNFQKAIEIILKPFTGRFVMVYMDDVIITSPSFNEHVDHLNQVFTLLRDSGLTLNKDKCLFARDKLKYLGLIINKEGIETDNSKDAFNKVKRALTEAPVLQLPNFQEQFNLFTDASGVGIGAVLNQNHRPIAFASEQGRKKLHSYRTRMFGGKSKRSRKTSSEESKDCKSNKGNAGWEDPRLKRKVRSNGSVDRTDKSGPKYAGKDLCRGANMGTRKDQPLNQQKG
ncbi:retrovirus-related Pol polyprotein from transposon 297 [Trichonephila clavipes]|nr:retrovirus-related Pol polyprotein from transposon 297 [Trichonephila clavipes]